CVAGGGPRRRWRRGTCRAARALAVEPRVDVALAEPPLPADADCWNLARLDQPVHGPEVDLEVFQDFLGREKRFVHHASCPATAAGSSTVNSAPPSGWLAATIWPPCS